MSDAMDQVQALAEAHAAEAVKRHSMRPHLEGRSTCANLDCQQPISDARRALGAQLCIDCQRGEEARAAHFQTWQGGR